MGLAPVTPADVSVVIPCFNSSLTLERAVRSVRQQTYSPREIIIIDDASDDDTAALIDELRQMTPDIDIVYVRRQTNGGAAVARNEAWQIASSMFIAFLDADDEWHPYKIERQLTVMLEHPEMVISGHRYTTSDEFGPAPSSVRLRTITLTRLLSRNYFSTPSVMIRRDVATRFRAGWSHSEDYLMWLETVARHGLALLLDEALVRLHKPAYGAAGLSANMWAMQRGELRAYQQLRRNGSISRVWCVAAILWSSAKFLRRVVLLRLRRA